MTIFRSEKLCKKCLIDKPIEEFFKQPSNRDGRGSTCRSCATKRARELRNARPLFFREKHRMDARKDKRKESIKRWREKVGPEKLGEYARRASERHKDKVLARTAVGNAIKAGKIHRQPCSVCGDEEVQAHHEDYSKPLDVIWLCRKHHYAHHVKLRSSLP